MKYFTRIHTYSRYIPVVTLSMISLLFLCFHFQTQLGATGNAAKTASFFSISGETARNGHILRLITANLFHVNPGHFQSNIFGLLFFSSCLEMVMGKPRTAIIILLSALGGTIGSLLFHIVDWMVGSSTILFGVFGGLGILIIKYRKELNRYFIPLVISWCISLIPMCTLGYLSLARVDQGAHVGGFFAGILTTWIMVYPYSMREINKPSSLRVRLFLVLLLAVFVLSIMKEIVPLFRLLA